MGTAVDQFVCFCCMTPPAYSLNRESGSCQVIDEVEAAVSENNNVDISTTYNMHRVTMNELVQNTLSFSYGVKIAQWAQFKIDSADFRASYPDRGMKAFTLAVVAWVLLGVGMG